MKKLLLIKLKEPRAERQKVTYVPPIGLWSMRAAGERVGVDVDVVDMHLGDIPAMNLYEYDTIGLSVQFSIQHQEFLRYAKFLKDETDAEIIAGGFHASAVPPPPSVDQVITGWGERLFGVETIEQLPHPIFAVDEIERYWDLNLPHDLQAKTKRWIPIETSRGCGYRCRFCGVTDYWGINIPIPQPQLDAYFAYLRARGITELFIEDDNLTFDLVRFREMMRSIKRFGFVWSVPNGIYVKDLLRNEVLDLITDSGCWRVSLPFETGSTRTAALMRTKHKFIDGDVAEQLVLRLKDRGIKTCGFFIIGYPGETKDDIMRTLEYANGLPLDQRNIYAATPYPGTALYRKCVDEQLFDCPGSYYDALLYSRPMITTDEFTAEDILKIREEDREKAVMRKTAEVGR